MKKLVALLLVIVTLLSFASCRERVKYENVTYRDGGIEFVLPSSMRRSYVSGYDFYFSTLAIVFTAIKLDAEFIEGAEMEISPTITAEEYTALVTEGMDQSQIYYNEDKSRNLYNFRYTFEDVSSGTEIFYYIVIVGTPGNVWYIEMCCDQQDSATYVETFDEWKKTITTYEE